ncbi:maleylacetoacetate isomerase, partial [Vibrio parahaemolyticus]
MKHWMVRGLGVYESLLGLVDLRGKRFSVADHPTLADLCLIPQCYSSLRFGVDLAQFPRCQSIYEHALT